ncbi:MAG: DUF882 domain-containing protein [Magnetospirillum sp.]|nr:DUF882 domain-containing protein [Magnetospirillum sp.]
MPHSERAPHPSRRSFLAWGLAAATATLVVTPLEAAVRALPERSLQLYNTHTGEWLRTTYWAEGRYLANSLGSASRILRDHRTGDIHPIDPRVLDLMVAVQRKSGVKGPIHIISGYRSPASNALLHDTSDGVATHSLHMEGRAVDIRLPGRSVRQVAAAARSLRVGGVGAYPGSGFVHVDTGRVRTW